MSEIPLLEPVTAKGHEGEVRFNQWRVAIDAYQTMCAFLHLDKEQKFTESDRQAIKRDLKRLAQAVGQMDAGQRGKGVPFDEVPHLMSRITAACCAWS